MSEARSSKKIDCNDPSVIRYHALKMKPKTIAQARRNMVKYLKNQGNYKINYGSERMNSPEKIEEEDVDTQKEIKEVFKEYGAKRKKSLLRKSTRSTIKRQKRELDDEKEDLKGYLDIVPREDVAEDVESLSTKYPIVDWKTCVLTENFMYYQVFRGDGSSKNYKVLSEMLEDFDRQDVMDLHRLVKERYSASRPEGYDLMLWGDLHTLFEPDEEDEIWKNQHEYNVIKNGNSWVPIPVTKPSETGTSTATKMTVPSTIKEKTCKKNDVKARSLLLMALPNEHQLTFDQYVDAQSMFAAIKAQFGRGMEAQKSLDSIFTQASKDLLASIGIWVWLLIQKDLTVKIFKELPSEWDYTCGSMVKKTAGAANVDKNLAFVNYFRTCNALGFSDATVYASITQLNVSNALNGDILPETARAPGVRQQKLESKVAQTRHANIALMAFSDSESKQLSTLSLFDLEDIKEPRDDDEPNPKVEKKIVIPTATKKEFVKPVKRSFRHTKQWSKSSLTDDWLKSLILQRPVTTVRFNTGRPFRSTVNTVRARGFNAVKPSACWVGRPSNPMQKLLGYTTLDPEMFKENLALLGSYENEPKDRGNNRVYRSSLINTARPEVNTGSREVSTAVPEVNTATPEDLSSVQTRRMTTSYSKLGFLSAIYEGKSHQDLHTCLFACFLSQEEPKRVSKALNLPKGHRAIGTKWVYRNKKDERGIVIRNKARLVAQGHTQEEGIGKTLMEVLHCFEDPDHPDKVYKVVKALYGLHQAPRAWYDTLANYLLCNGFQRGKIDQTLFIKRQKGHILLVQIYVDDIIFKLQRRSYVTEFETLMRISFK
ncbi:putative ribonuclease H-like domain-containing protein [Tanacetum coccineum]